MLQIDHYVASENTSVLAELLRCHPEVRLKGYDTGKVFKGNLELQHICELNWHGRYLVDGSARAPLSLWPSVFERVNDKPSIIYDFLKGPAFAARND